MSKLCLGCISISYARHLQAMHELFFSCPPRALLLLDMVLVDWACLLNLLLGCSGLGCSFDTYLRLILVIFIIIRAGFRSPPRLGR